MLLYILILLAYECEDAKDKRRNTLLKHLLSPFLLEILLQMLHLFFLLCSILQFLSSIFTRYCVLFCCLHCVFWSFMFYFFLFLLCLCNMVPLKCSFILICFGFFCNSLPMVHTWYKQLAGYRVCTLWLK